MASLNSPRFTMMNIIIGFTIVFALEVGKSNCQDNFFNSTTSPKTLCEMTPYPNACYYIQKEGVNDSLLLYKLSVQLSIQEVLRVSTVLNQTFKDMKDPSLISAIESCQILLSLSLNNLNQSIPTTSFVTPDTQHDFQTWLSAADADLETCIDGFEYATDNIRNIVNQNLDNSTKLISNSLSIISKIDDLIHDDKQGKLRTNGWPPSWLSSEDKSLFLNESKQMKPDIVVAGDGTGNFKTINEAIRVVPPFSPRRFVIYVKKGVYFENVRIGYTKVNVMIFGDGMDQTIVSAKLSNGSGVATFLSATFAVDGSGFIARDIGFYNTAGPTRFQAVALLSTADKSVFYRCRIDGYQDSLYAHSSRQFYRECSIYGTIDFIFGRSSVVIQKSNILVKKPLFGQENTITADLRRSPQFFTGISIQLCNISAAEYLGGARTFLGRPLKSYSTTIFLENVLNSLIDPQGWFYGTPNAVPPDTIFYAEYKNKGPGAVIGGRVKWRGLRLNIPFA
ncbi:Pectinesterase [Handroanthus impetiginosus]|uniref:Pectinesterase n=1 Tax=Handroanthus impetiginosus TaxID=429701 RepID=A0A2G9GA19_9LAMI|nr:Pectinesterase [Handroanthus impetiginosus]